MLPRPGSSSRLRFTGRISFYISPGYICMPQKTHAQAACVCLNAFNLALAGEEGAVERDRQPPVHAPPPASPGCDVAFFDRFANYFFQLLVVHRRQFRGFDQCALLRVTRRQRSGFCRRFTKASSQAAETDVDEGNVPARPLPVPSSTPSPGPLPSDGQSLHPRFSAGCRASMPFSRRSIACSVVIWALIEFQQAAVPRRSRLPRHRLSK